MPEPKHFVDIHHVGRDTLREILDLGVEEKARLKSANGALNGPRPMAGKTLAMISRWRAPRREGSPPAIDFTSDC